MTLRSPPHHRGSASERRGGSFRPVRLSHASGEASATVYAGITSRHRRGFEAVTDPRPTPRQAGEGSGYRYLLCFEGGRRSLEAGVPSTSTAYGSNDHEPSATQRLVTLEIRRPDEDRPMPVRLVIPAGESRTSRLRWTIARPGRILRRRSPLKALRPAYIGRLSSRPDFPIMALPTPPAERHACARRPRRHVLRTGMPPIPELPPGRFGRSRSWIDAPGS